MAAPTPERSATTKPVLVVTGLVFEARIAAGSGEHDPAGRYAGAPRVICGLGGAALASRIEAALAEEPCAGVLSFGTAGALVDGLVAGDWVVANAITADGERYAADTAWRDALARRLNSQENDGTMAGTDAAHRDTARRVTTPIEFAGTAQPATTPSDKRALNAASGASAVDMESQIVARVARAHGVPFAACRVIIDPVHRTLPQAAQVAVRPDGSTHLAAVLASLAAHPAQLPDLLRLARDAGAARRALQRGRRLLGPRFGFPDFS